MSRVILLDAGSLGIVTKRRGVPDAEACRAWVACCLRQGAHILVPAIAYYEVCRELERMRNTTGLARVEAFCSAVPDRYCPSPILRSGSAVGCGRRRARRGHPRRPPVSWIVMCS
jgi:predicted nucleic acid-binding protein